MSECRVVNLKELGVSKEVFDKIYSMGEEDERANIIEEIDLHLKEANYEYDSNMGIGDNISSALLKAFANGVKSGISLSED